MTDAYDELLDFLSEGETVECLYLSEFSEQWMLESWKVPPLPADARPGTKLTLEQAEPYMRGWTIQTGYSMREPRVFRAWTLGGPIGGRIIGVGEFDSSTFLVAVPRFPFPDGEIFKPRFM